MLHVQYFISFWRTPQIDPVIHPVHSKVSLSKANASTLQPRGKHTRSLPRVNGELPVGAHAKLPEQDRVVGVIVVGRRRDSDDVILVYDSVLYSNVVWMHVLQKRSKERKKITRCKSLVCDHNLIFFGLLRDGALPAGVVRWCGAQLPS
jgi:hypothetical protein